MPGVLGAESNFPLLPVCNAIGRNFFFCLPPPPNAGVLGGATPNAGVLGGAILARCGFGGAAGI